MKRIALLGATGSIGRQALEIIDADPELELCAASSGTTPIEGLAPLTQVGGDPTELLERAEPDLVLNAVVGFAGLPATLWALERGVDLALANKESLVAAGELALAAQRRGRGRLLPVAGGAGPELTLSAIWARRPDAARELADQHGALAAPTFEDLLLRCDAVAFSVPPDVQAMLAPRAARAGKHLLLEKPLAFTVSDAEAVATAVDEAGVVTQLMLTYRFARPVRDFLAALDGSTVRHVRIEFVASGALAGSPFATPWRQMPGSAVLDLGPHALDLAEAAAGPITQVWADDSGGVVAVTTQHETGAIGHVTLSVTTPGAGPLEAAAVTDAGRVVLPAPADQHFAADVQHTIANEFARAISGDRAHPIDVHRGVELQRLLAAVTESVRTRRTVST